jgi:hypothetical protein
VAAVTPLVLDADLQVAAAGVAYGCGGRRNLVGAGRAFSYDAASRWTIAGPTLLAGFYCREALLALGGFSTRMGDTHADLDLALFLDELGLKAVFEPAAQARLLTSHDASLRRGFSAGRQAERFYRQHGGRSARVTRWVVHPIAVAGDALSRLPGLNAVTSLLGRSLGWLEVSPAAEHQKRLGQASSLLEGESSATISLAAARAQQQAQAAPIAQRRAA